MAVPDGDWGGSNRRDTFVAELVDPWTLESTGEEIDVVAEANSVTLGYYTDNYYTASLSSKHEVPGNRLVRLVHTATLRDGTEASETLGTYFADSSSESGEAGNVTHELSLKSTWYRYKGDQSTMGDVKSSGEDVTQYFRRIITDRGGILKRLDGGGALVLGSTCSHEAGDLVSGVLSDIANSCGKRVTVDDMGYVTLADQPDWETVPTAYTFEEGRGCAFARGYVKSDSNDDKVNRAVAMGSLKEGEGDSEVEYGLSETANLTAANPFAYANIGRYVTRVDDYGELDMSRSAASEWLASKAKATLDENSGSIWYYEIEHVGVPGLRHGDVVRYVNYTDGEKTVDARCMITQMEIGIGAGCWTKTKMKVLS